MKKTSSRKSKSQMPARYQHFEKSYPTIMKAVEALGEATQSAGPLDNKTRALVKLAIAIGAAREGAVHSHTRRALEAGCKPDELRHVGVLAISTIGFPATMAATSWVEDILRGSR
jgi:alkylhydroperoxidase/carboxymuconolactone decarboxylase family protein YurZ